MKFKTIVIAMTLLLQGVIVSGQGTAFQQTWILLQPTDATNALNEIFTRMSVKLFSAVKEGKLAAYPAEQVTDRITSGRFTEMTTISETIPWYDESGNLRDTTITYAGNNFYELYAGDKWIRCFLNENTSVYLKSSDALKLLDKDEKWMLRFIATRNQGKMKVSDPEGDPLSLITDLNNVWYKWAMAGKLSAYRSDSLTDTYTVAELATLGSVKDEVVANPDENGEFATHSVVSPFDPQNLSGLFLFCRLEHTKDGYNLKPYSYAPAYFPSIAGIELPYTAMFFMTLRDADRLLSADEKQLISIISSYALRDSLSKRRF